MTFHRRECSAGDLWNICWFRLAGSSYNVATTRAPVGRWRTSPSEKQSSLGIPSRSCVWGQAGRVSSAQSLWNTTGSCALTTRITSQQAPSRCVYFTLLRRGGTARSTVNGNHQRCLIGFLRWNRRTKRVRPLLRFASVWSVWIHVRVVSKERPSLYAFPGWRNWTFWRYS
jgi:hypothetical protein